MGDSLNSLNACDGVTGPTHISCESDPLTPLPPLSGGARRSLDAHGSRTASSEVPRRPESVLGQSGLGQGAVRGASEARGVTRVSSTGTDRDEEAW